MSKSTAHEMDHPSFLKDADFIREAGRENGVRMIHKVSGAVGEGKDEQIALQNLVKTEVFRRWYTAECLQLIQKDIPAGDLALKEQILAIVERSIDRALAERVIALKRE